MIIFVLCYGYEVEKKVKITLLYKKHYLTNYKSQLLIRKYVMLVYNNLQLYLFFIYVLLSFITFMFNHCNICEAASIKTTY